MADLCKSRDPDCSWRRCALYQGHVVSHYGDGVLWDGPDRVNPTLPNILAALYRAGMDDDQAVEWLSNWTYEVLDPVSGNPLERIEHCYTAEGRARVLGEALALTSGGGDRD